MSNLGDYIETAVSYGENVLGEINKTGVMDLIDGMDVFESIFTKSSFIISTMRKTKLYWFYHGLCYKDMDQENINKAIESLGDTDELATYIDKQINSHHKYANFIAGLVVKKGVIKGGLSSVQINHIEFLLTLNETDILNYASIVERSIAKDTKNKLSMNEMDDLPNVRVTIGKMNSYGYNKFELYGGYGGLNGVNLTNINFDLYENYIMKIIK